MRLIGVETEEFTDAVLNMVVHMRGGLVADEEERAHAHLTVLHLQSALLPSEALVGRSPRHPLLKPLSTPNGSQGWGDVLAAYRPAGRRRRGGPDGALRHGEHPVPELATEGIGGHGVRGGVGGKIGVVYMFIFIRRGDEGVHDFLRGAPGGGDGPFWFCCCERGEMKSAVAPVPSGSSSAVTHSHPQPPPHFQFSRFIVPPETAL